MLSPPPGELDDLHGKGQGIKNTLSAGALASSRRQARLPSATARIRRFFRSRSGTHRGVPGTIRSYLSHSSLLSKGGFRRAVIVPFALLAATWVTASALERSTAQPIRRRPTSRSDQPEADQRRQASACHTPGWFTMACLYAECLEGSPAGHAT